MIELGDRIAHPRPSNDDLDLVRAAGEGMAS